MDYFEQRVVLEFLFMKGLRSFFDEMKNFARPNLHSDPLCHYSPSIKNNPTTG
jgi:hypothetical protein